MTKTRDTASGSTKKKFGGQTKLEAHTSGVTVTGNISATGTVDGRDVAADGTKLDTVATSSNNYVHPTGAGNNHIPTGGAADQVLTYSSSGVAAWADAGHQRQSCLISIASNRLISGSRNWATQWNLARVVSLFRYLGAVFLANKS